MPVFRAINKQNFDYLNVISFFLGISIINLLLNYLLTVNQAIKKQDFTINNG